jgi:hypothetical protein
MNVPMGRFDFSPVLIILGGYQSLRSCVPSTATPSRRRAAIRSAVAPDRHDHRLGRLAGDLYRWRGLNKPRAIHKPVGARRPRLCASPCVNLCRCHWILQLRIFHSDATPQNRHLQQYEVKRHERIRLASEVAAAFFADCKLDSPRSGTSWPARHQDASGDNNASTGGTPRPAIRRLDQSKGESWHQEAMA